MRSSCVNTVTCSIANEGNAHFIGLFCVVFHFCRKTFVYSPLRLHTFILKTETYFCGHCIFIQMMVIKITMKRKSGCVFILFWIYLAKIFCNVTFFVILYLVNKQTPRRRQ